MSSEETYKGKNIVIKSENGKTTLEIDGKKILTGKDEITGKYFSNQQPHQTFEPLSDLAKAIVDDQKEKTNLDKHYLLVTTFIAVGVASVNSLLLYSMSLGSTTNGIGLAMVGIVTFFGMLIASSVFEEHRHEHAPTSKTNKPTAGEKMVAKVVAGKGIMRKALASSLIIVYIIVVGLYVDNGELSEPFAAMETTTSESQKLPENSTKDSKGELTDSVGFATLQLVQDEGGGAEPETEEEEQKEAEAKKEAETEKEAKKPAKPIPRSLLEHFTTVVTAIIIFYFGSDIATNWFKNKYGSSSTTDGGSTPAAGSNKTGKKKKKSE